jgi:hypothetical protein
MQKAGAGAASAAEAARIAVGFFGGSRQEVQFFRSAATGLIPLRRQCFIACSCLCRGAAS